MALSKIGHAPHSRVLLIENWTSLFNFVDEQVSVEAGVVHLSLDILGDSALLVRSQARRVRPSSNAFPLLLAGVA